jgi:hypothetical protein
VTLVGPVSSTCPRSSELVAKLLDKRLHSGGIADELRLAGVDLRVEDIHRVPAIIGAFHRPIESV